MELADILPVEENIVSQERQPPGIAKHMATTEFEFTVSSGVRVSTQDRVQQCFVEQMAEVSIPVPSVTEQLVVVSKIVFHDRIQRWLPSKLSTCQVLRSFFRVVFRQCCVEQSFENLVDETG